MSTSPAGKKSSGRKSPTQRKAAKKSSKKKAQRKWSKKVNETSNAMDLEQGVFKGTDPKKIAQSLKRSSSKSKRRKGTPYQSAMSMLNLYINRGGKNLPASRKKILEKTKDELKEMFGRPE